eukprot:1053704-Rhodomonas_salina.2
MRVTCCALQGVFVGDQDHLQLVVQHLRAPASLSGLATAERARASTGGSLPRVCTPSYPAQLSVSHRQSLFAPGATSAPDIA